MQISRHTPLSELLLNCRLMYGLNRNIGYSREVFFFFKFLCRESCAHELVPYYSLVSSEVDDNDHIFEEMLLYRIDRQDTHQQGWKVDANWSFTEIFSNILNFQRHNICRTELRYSSFLRNGKGKLAILRGQWWRKFWCFVFRLSRTCRMRNADKKDRVFVIGHQSASLKGRQAS